MAALQSSKYPSRLPSAGSNRILRDYAANITSKLFTSLRKQDVLGCFSTLFVA